jgi:hypothetical protein
MGPPAVSGHRQPCLHHHHHSKPLRQAAYHVDCDARTALILRPPWSPVIDRLSHRHPRQNAQRALVQATRSSIHQSRRQANVDWTAHFPASRSLQPQLERATSPEQRPTTTKKFLRLWHPFPPSSLAHTHRPGLNDKQSGHASAPRPPEDRVYR